MPTKHTNGTKIGEAEKGEELRVKPRESSRASPLPHISDRFSAKKIGRCASWRACRSIKKIRLVDRW